MSDFLFVTSLAALPAVAGMLIAVLIRGSLHASANPTPEAVILTVAGGA